MCELYNRIHEECERIGITDAKLCYDLGYSASTLSDLKTGKKKTLSQEKLSAIADYLNVSIDYLVKGKEKAPTQTGEDVIDAILSGMTEAELIEVISKATERLKKG